MCKSITRARHLLIVACALAALPAVVLADPTNLITNGGFESGINAPVSGFRTIAASSAYASDINGWNVTGGSVDWIGDYWKAAENLRSLDLGGLANGTIIAQTVPTVPDAWYELRFYLAGNPDGLPKVKSLNVLLNGGVLASPTFDDGGATRQNMQWVEQVFRFRALSATTTIGFQATDGSQPGYPDGSPWGPALDDVRLVAVPVPGAVVLGLLGFGMIGWLKRRLA